MSKKKIMFFINEMSFHYVYYGKLRKVCFLNEVWYTRCSFVYWCTYLYIRHSVCVYLNPVYTIVMSYIGLYLFLYIEVEIMTNMKQNKTLKENNVPLLILVQMQCTCSAYI